MTIVADVLAAYWAASAGTTDLGDGVLVRGPGVAYLHQVRASDAPALDALLGQATTVLGIPLGQVVLDPSAPPFVEAELRVRGWSVDHATQLVLPADVALARDPDAPVRPAVDADWPALRELFRADHVEEDRRADRAPRPREHTDRAVDARRSLDARYFVADEGDGAVGFVAGWPGAGVGVVEDLFVRADRRGRGLARALIGEAVAWARAGGAGSVVIGAVGDDTPQRLYARLGFVPTLVLRSLSAPAPSAPSRP